MGYKVSVVMPSYNVEPYIKECMDSVLNQTLQDIEVIVVDADSTDGTQDILHEYAATDSRVKILRDDRKSTGYANNIAIDQAQGEYVGIVETDDYITPDMYEILYDIARQEKCDVVKGDYWSFSGSGNDRMFIKRKLWMDFKDKYGKVIDPRKEKYIFDAIMFNWAGIFRRDFLNEYRIRHQETPGASFQDNGFYFQTMAFAQRVYFENKSFYRYRRDNPNSSINKSDKVFCMCDEYDFIEKIIKNYPELWDTYYYGYMRRRYGACSWTLKKVLPEYKHQLANRMHEDLLRLLRSEADLKVIPREERYYNEMRLLYDDVDQYVSEMVKEQNQYEDDAQELCNCIRGDVLIFGCGECGTGMDSLLMGHGVAARAYIDNDKELQGTTFNRKPVLSVNEAMALYPNAFILSTIQKEWDTIRTQLVKSGVSNEMIIDIDIKKYIWD